MTEIKNNHQAVLMLQSAKNYFEDVAIETNQPPTVIAAFAGLIDAVQFYLDNHYDCDKIQKELDNNEWWKVLVIIIVAKTFYFTSDKPHYENEPFEVPSSWVWTTLGDIAEIITGNTPSKDIKEYYSGNIPFFKPTDLEQGIHTKYSKDRLTDRKSVV